LKSILDKTSEVVSSDYLLDVVF